MGQSKTMRSDRDPKRMPVIVWLDQPAQTDRAFSWITSQPQVSGLHSRHVLANDSRS